jgi:ABC-type transporter Mla subunit MlaD
MMEKAIEARLQELRKELASGQQVMAELQSRQADVQQTLLRISGAIQVLEELLNEAARQSSGTINPSE